MFAPTTIQTNYPLLLYDYKKEAEIRSIESIYSEYNTMDSVSNYKSDIKDIIIKLYNNEFMLKSNTTSTNNLLGETMSSWYITRNKIEVLNHIYEFRTEFIYHVTQHEDGYIAESEYFNAFGYGNTMQEAEEELFIYINDLWEGYAEEDDKNLDSSALDLKEKLLNSIRKIK